MYKSFDKGDRGVYKDSIGGRPKESCCMFGPTGLWQRPGST